MSRVSAVPASTGRPVVTSMTHCGSDQGQTVEVHAALAFAYRTGAYMTREQAQALVKVTRGAASNRNLYTDGPVRSLQRVRQQLDAAGFSPAGDLFLGGVPTTEGHGHELADLPGRHVEPIQPRLPGQHP